MTNILELFGRILISTLFFLNGIFKINNYDSTIDWVESFGFPGILIIPAIILEIAGSILIVIGYKTRVTAGVLSLFCLATAIIFHNDFDDQMQLTSFLKKWKIKGELILKIS